MSVFDENGLSAAAPEPGAQVQDEQGFAEAPLAPLHPTSDAPRMVIVEDAPLIALDLAETMRELGFDVRATAFTHEQALTEIERTVPQFAIVGLHLGVGEGDVDRGEALLELLDELGCRCLIFSGDEEACRRVAARYPHFPVLSKPAQPETLVAEIQKLRALGAG
ncbi:MAG TPA: hypothetical protein VFJ13_06265 [Paracoccaceae bacterium]|nr:hypothetical protein [Paracoccaceae bacterium]